MKVHSRIVYEEKVALLLREERLEKSGGSAWESNPPTRVLARYTGFEVREPHQ